MKKRLKSIDILRGIAISCMIIGHVHQRWTWGLYETWFGYLIVFLGLWSPPFFVLISGISFFILINHRIKAELPRKKIISEILKRAIFIFSISTIFNMLFGFLLKMQAEFLFGFLYWSIFQLIGISMIFCFYIPFIKRNFRFFIYIIAFITIFLLTHVILFYEIKIIFFLVEAAGPFPLLPWLSMFLLGVLIGDILLNMKEANIQFYLIGFFVIGLTSFILWLFWAYKYTYLLFDRFVEGIGLFFILFSILYYIADIKQKDNIAFKKLINWGNFSFSIYYYHYLIILIGLILFPIIILGWDPINTNIFQYIFLIILVFVILDLSLILWNKFDYKYGLEWFMRKISQTSIIDKIKEYFSQPNN